MYVNDASAADITKIKEIEDECFSLPWTEKQLSMMLDKDRFVFIAAFDEENSPIGYAGMQYVLDEGYIGNVAVTKSYREKGIGSLLIGNIIERARKLNLSFLTLEVRESNCAAIALYSKYEFIRVAVRKNYYDFPKEDAIIMTKKIV